jgi:hypothetical protein
VAVIAYQVDGAAAAVGIGRGAAVEVVIHGSTVLGCVAAQARAEGTRGRQPGRWVVRRRRARRRQNAKVAGGGGCLLRWAN